MLPEKTWRGKKRSPALVMQVELQGSLIKVSNRDYMPDSTHPAPRGIIRQFSKKSRKRLMDMINRLKRTHVRMPLFVSVTYPWLMTDGNRAKRDLNTFIKRILRDYPQAAILWRMEYQSRGAIHFHMLIWNVPFIPWQTIRQDWREIIGHTGDALATDIRRIYNPRHLMSYVSKYLAKSDAGSLDNAPYLTGSIGRFWGIVGRARLPWAARAVIVVATSKPYHDFRRAARKFYPRIGSSRTHRGFTLYADSKQWYNYLVLLLFS